MGYYSAGDAAQAMMMSTGRSHAPMTLATSPSNSTPPSDSGRSYRRTNPGNVRALRRAMRRMQSFEKLARSVMSFTHRKSGAKFKFHRRKRK